MTLPVVFRVIENEVVAFPPLKGQALFMRVCPFSFGPSRASAILYRWMQKSEICTATLDVAS